MRLFAVLVIFEPPSWQPVLLLVRAQGVVPGLLPLRLHARHLGAVRHEARAGAAAQPAPVGRGQGRRQGRVLRAEEERVLVPAVVAGREGLRHQGEKRIQMDLL